MSVKNQIADVAHAKGAVTANSVSLFGWEFNFYGVFLLAALVLFVYLLWKAQRNKRLDWVDLITKDGVTVSLTKILQLVGGFVGTWIVVQMTIAGDMTWDILAVYLAYVASIESFSKFIIAKYRNDDFNGRRGGGGYYDGGYGGGGYRPPVRRPLSGNEQDDTDERLRSGAAKPEE